VNSRSAIFTVILVLLVPLGYSSFATNEACAAVMKVQGSETCTYSRDKTERTCCFLLTGPELNLKPGTTAVKACQDCTKDRYGEWKCEKAKQAYAGSLPDDSQDSLDVKPTQPTEPKFPRGDILPDEDEPTINDPPTTTEPKNLDPGKIEIPNLK